MRTLPLCLVLCLALTGLSVARGAAPLLEKINLFENDADGYKNYRIPGLLVTANGTVLATCEARRTSGKDWDQIDILLRRSTDGGRTWSARRAIANVPGPKLKNPLALALPNVDPTTVTYNNFVLIADRAGPVHAVFCLEYYRCFYMRSDDEGVTFSTPVEITSTFEAFRKDYDWKVIATGPAHGLQLANGRLLVPVWLSLATGRNAHRPSVTATIYSDDLWKTWKRGEIAVPDTAEWVYPNETIAVQLVDGRVMLNVRSESPTHRRLVTTSPDGATQWSTPKFDQALLEPICMASILRLSTTTHSDKNRILFANPDSLAKAKDKKLPGERRERRNLSVKLSYDEGTTWAVNRVLEPGLSSYSDLAVLRDGTILCLYERVSTKGPSGATGGFISMARFNLEWLTEGKDSLSATRR